MGGMGSGRPKRSNLKTTENVIALDIVWLAKQGGLDCGCIWHIAWVQRGQQVADLQGYTAGEGLVLFYDTIQSNTQQCLTQFIRWDTTPCHFGGCRRWLVCPCGQRVRKVYWNDRGWRCRSCCHLTFATQREDRLARLQRKVRNLRNHLEPNLEVKPHRMHWQRYERLYQALVLLKREEASLLRLQLQARLRRLLGSSRYRCRTY